MFFIDIFQFSEHTNVPVVGSPSLINLISTFIRRTNVKGLNILVRFARKDLALKQLTAPTYFIVIQNSDFKLSSLVQFELN